MDFRHKGDMFLKKIRPYGLPVLFGLILVVGLVYLTTVYLPRNIPRLESTSSPSTTGMRIPTVTLPLASSLNPTLTITFTPRAIWTVTALPTPGFPQNPGIGSSWTSPLDDMVMVYVPEGEFSMGSDNGRLDELPVHTVYLDAFWIDQTEVTNRMYALCVAEGACLQPPNSGNCSLWDFCPVINVNWDSADAYCQWAGRRLPTEAEWEKAARGTDGRTYPWGNSFPTCSLATLLNLGYGTSLCASQANWLETTIVGSHPAGASPYGALDMAGNVWEWVNDWYSATYYSQSPGSNPTGPASGDYHVLRGVSWMQNIDSVRSAYRFGFGSDPNVGGYLGIGFRCARNANP
jgi:serine/threonine-protein kinase